MTEKEKLPPVIRTLNFFGCKMQDTGEKNWQGSCPVCGKRDHLYADAESTKWDCKVCGSAGNQMSLLTKVHAARVKTTEDADLERLSKIRGGMPIEILKGRNIVWDERLESWFIPSYAQPGKIRDLRKYDGKRLLATAGMELNLFGLDRLANAPKGTTVMLCEGEWDAIAFDWLQSYLKKPELYVSVGLPGATTLKSDWFKYFTSRRTLAVFDNDDAGDRGAEKADKHLRTKCSELKFVHWPSKCKAGYDLRDYITERIPRIEKGEYTAEALIEELFSISKAKPRTTMTEEDDAEHEAEPVDPIGFEELMVAFAKHARMTKDMERAIRLCCAVAISTDIGGDPLWLYLVAPPGTGKTLILGAMDGSARCVHRSSVTPNCLISGWREGNDPSLIPKLSGKTFVCKDFTEVLSMAQVAQEEVFSTLRGAYDGKVIKTYGNGVERVYDNCHFAMIAGVTHAIHGSSKASLGERFLKFQMSHGGRAHMEEVIDAAINSVGHESEIESALQESFKKFLANKVDPSRLPRMPPHIVDRLKAMVQLVAYLRAQVDRDPRTGEFNYRPTSEVGTRLAKQLTKLCFCLAVVDGRIEINEADYELANRVAIDTGYGFYLDIVETMMKRDGQLTRNEIAKYSDVHYSTVARRLEDLTALGVVKKIDAPAEVSGPGRPPTSYTVIPEVRELWLRAQGTPPPKKLVIRSPSSVTAAKPVKLRISKT